MAKSYRVKLEKEHLIFSAAHFITFADNICERIHGHNYRVYAEVQAPLDGNQYVIDFIALRDTLKEITGALDHHVLLPMAHEQIKVTPDHKEVLVTFEERRWIFPLDDCVLLPLSNTTAELLADYIATELVKRLSAKGLIHIDQLEIGVDENEGQWGVVTRTGDDLKLV
ncbi:MAG: 6-carboxytetrahydropterin synthase [Pirellulales bacterium]|jgi:6-pyruvoyltetrahydropterin/6-carboxytetrahydropterin synthase|nr:6-pyruvoyl tetrahydrobiopterin synthase [Rhodopirellula sp.]MCH2370620.1 6-carboxytetrahydropterin synthase [Pirellulales bacterium]|tara:strand:+ start:64 stop:570 length:507 start_codon:yes stop_codon:yes gene_type:complete